MHLGYARLLLMSRKIGVTVIVGVQLHRDKETQTVKCPVVMPLQERLYALINLLSKLCS